MNQTQLAACAVIYGIGVALTFDEFGMWLHLGGSYWQRARFDAVVALLGIFGLIGLMPRWQHLRAHHFATMAVLLITVISFYLLLFKSLNHADDKVLPHLLQIEESRTALSWQVFDWPQQPRSAEAPTKCRGYNLS
jgi:hypothetical protein